MPAAAEPGSGSPTNETRLREMTTLRSPDAEMPYDDVPVMANPEITMLLRPDRSNALVPPATAARPPALKVIGWVRLPECAGLTEVPGYRPAVTRTVFPATARRAAAPMVQNGRAGVPGPASEHAEEVLLTV